MDTSPFTPSPCQTPATVAVVYPLLPRPLDSGALRALLHEARPVPRPVSFDAEARQLACSLQVRFQGEREVCGPCPLRTKPISFFLFERRALQLLRAPRQESQVCTRSMGDIWTQMTITGVRFDVGEWEKASTMQEIK